jgi:hypothetical protein
MDREERAIRDRAARHDRVTNIVMPRKPMEDHPPLPTSDYSFPAIVRAMADRSGSDEFHTMLDSFADQSASGGDELRKLIG